MKTRKEPNIDFLKKIMKKERITVEHYQENNKEVAYMLISNHIVLSYKNKKYDYVYKWDEPSGFLDTNKLAKKQEFKNLLDSMMENIKNNNIIKKLEIIKKKL